MLIGQKLSDKIFLASPETNRNAQKHFQVWTCVMLGSTTIISSRTAG